MVQNIEDIQIYPKYPVGQHGRSPRYDTRKRKSWTPRRPRPARIDTTAGSDHPMTHKNDPQDQHEATILPEHYAKMLEYVRFTIAWLEKRHFLVTDTNLSDSFLEADPEYYETFGEVLLVCFLEIDKAKS
ncbi:hypothetical protein DTO271D3_4536 [Paecilomyces variotii]|nr:hypothetical protein DTO271D3_4536 [Paecilomyces variotii]